MKNWLQPEAGKWLSPYRGDACLRFTAHPCGTTLPIDPAVQATRAAGCTRRQWNRRTESNWNQSRSSGFANRRHSTWISLFDKSSTPSPQRTSRAGSAVSGQFLTQIQSSSRIRVVSDFSAGVARVSLSVSEIEKSAICRELEGLIAYFPRQRRKQADDHGAKDWLNLVEITSFGLIEEQKSSLFGEDPATLC